LYYSYFFCCFVEKKNIPLWSLFLIVYLHLQWNAVLTQIMLCLAEAVLRNSRYAHYIFYLHIFISWKKKGGGEVH
jgi:hypothetical protein